MSSVEDSGPDPTGRRGSWWSATVQWRNWPLLVKLGVVLVVPVVSALVLGVLRVQADVELADSYAAIERVATLREQLVTVVSAVQQERGQAVRATGALEQAAVTTDEAIAAMGAVVAENPELADANSGYPALDRALDSLPAARRQVTGGAGGMIVLSAYNAVIDTALEFDRTLVGRFPDENLTSTSIALSELQGMREEISLEEAIGTLALRDRGLPDAARELLVEADVRFDDKLDDFRAQAPPALAARYDDAVTGQSVAVQQQMVDAIRTTNAAALPFSQQEWDAASAATTALMTDLTERAASALRADSGALAESVSDRAGLESVLLLTMVLLAAGVGGGLGRYLLRSVGLLRRTALDVANTGLPAAVASIRAGKGASIKVDPVPLRSTEEFGQLARAFDAVHDQAVRSAAEEASLRSNLANIFTNLSRRSQGLVERQLRLMEQLEQKTEDPEQLENLFKIDHLATRMRRNNENLMVLSGTGLLRRFNEPMPLPDVLRAAISEVEHYQRAMVRSVPAVRIAGYAAGDLIRSISELIENATAFSPPDAQVTIVSRLLPDGSAVIDIVDQGVGMGDRELREANQKITGGGGVDVPISRQMGLFVVGRLTARHGIHVRLIQRAEGGLCASVLVPAGLVNIADPGQTVAIDLPAALQGSAPQWPSQPGAPASWPSVADTPTATPAWPAQEDRPAPAPTSSWLVGAAETDSATAGTGERSMAAGWLGSARNTEPATGGPPAAPAPMETNAAGLPVRGRRSGRPAPTERSGDAERLDLSNGTTATNEPNAAGLPVRVPGAAVRPAETAWLDTGTAAQGEKPTAAPGQRSMAAGWLKAARAADPGSPPPAEPTASPGTPGSPTEASTPTPTNPSDAADWQSAGPPATAAPSDTADWQSADAEGGEPGSAGRSGSGGAEAGVPGSAGWQSGGGAEGGVPGSAERLGAAGWSESGGAEAAGMGTPGSAGWQLADGAEGGERGSAGRSGSGGAEVAGMGVPGSAGWQSGGGADGGESGSAERLGTAGWSESGGVEAAGMGVPGSAGWQSGGADGGERGSVERPGAAGWSESGGVEAAGVGVPGSAGWQSGGGADGGESGSAEWPGAAGWSELGSGAEGWVAGSAERSGSAGRSGGAEAGAGMPGSAGWQSGGGADGGESGSVEQAGAGSSVGAPGAGASGWSESGSEAEAAAGSASSGATPAAAEAGQQPVGAEEASVAGDAAYPNGESVGQEAGRAGGSVGYHLPGEVFEPVEVAGRLESAGIIVTLPDLPAASTPASILFADSTLGGDGGPETSRFSWLRNPPGAGASEPVAGVAPVAPTAPAVGPAGLPKRVPKSQLLASTQPPQPPAGNRDAVRARGFLSGFQAGIRQGENREGETGS